ncbi:MAG: hypothetical protein NUK65_11915, partial [Firmicutes bacterium]|nr:hypothetical protein [Bacillota bacterium]
MGKETSTLVQTEPHLYQRVEATGKLFNSHFNPVYFEVENGQVKRMSGDFLPLPSGHTVPWLVASALLTIVAVLYLIITPLILQLGKLLHKKDDVTALSANVRMQKLASLLLLTGTAIVLNNIVLVVRMLINNYRSFSEVRLQVLLNYPLATVAAVLSIVLIININRATCTKKQKIFYWTTVSVIVVFVGILAKWQFFTLLA